ncbi:hypothetical protein ZIOFF_019168 [Zingiber officinale]|uniref:RFTS domain-containing protein n=1 Tax=Zingiber officinale TaxID=94328 RepID=A0A8J5H958_ZINOF|nr:hypothetical protein ZIOFF_019168 [Zingiber officinale]
MGRRHNYQVKGVGVERSGSERRLAIDETNLFETLGGIQPFIDLSTNFYNRVFADEEEWGSDLSFQSRRRRTRFGTSHLALIGRHAPFPVTHQAAERWHTAYFLMGGNEMTRQRQQVLNFPWIMASLEDSDDEEVAPQSVANYFFVDDDESPISFSVLPLHFDDGLKQEVADNAVFLHGTTDGGLQKVYKQVIGWKLVFEDVEPKIMVLSKDKKWISLVKPRNSYYEGTIRTIMITVHLLHFLRKNPQATERSLWEHLRTVFSTFEVRPSHNDVREHVFLMKLFNERDETLANSQALPKPKEALPLCLLSPHSDEQHLLLLFRGLPSPLVSISDRQMSDTRWLAAFQCKQQQTTVVRVHHHRCVVGQHRR